MTLTLHETIKTRDWLREQIERLEKLPRPDLIDEQIAGLRRALDDLNKRIDQATQEQPPHTPLTRLPCGSTIRRYGILLCLLFTLLLGGCAVFFDPISSILAPGSDRVAPPPLAPRVAHDNLKLAMRYHGIGFATIDHTGAWFEREGKRCRLWTDGAKRYVQACRRKHS